MEKWNPNFPTLWVWIHHSVISLSRHGGASGSKVNSALLYPNPGPKHPYAAYQFFTFQVCHLWQSSYKTLHIFTKSSAWIQSSRTFLTFEKAGLSQTEEDSALNKEV